MTILELDDYRKRYFCGLLDITREEYDSTMRQYGYYASDPPPDIIELWQRDISTMQTKAERDTAYDDRLEYFRRRKALAYYKANKDLHGKIDGIPALFDYAPWL